MPFLIPRCGMPGYLLNGIESKSHRLPTKKATHLLEKNWTQGPQREMGEEGCP